MNYEMYSIFDKIAGMYSEPFLAVNGATAQRRFQWQMQQSTMVAGDCALYKVGDFDVDTGKIVPCVTFVCNYEVTSNE